MKNRLVFSLLGCSALLLPACGGTSSGSGGSSSRMKISVASNGFGQLLPHRVFQADAQGLPTNQIVEITKRQHIVDNVSLTNPILPATEWPTTETLPGSANAPGNHFIYVQFTQPIDIDSVFDPATGAAVTNNLLSITVTKPGSNGTERVLGKPFIGGQTLGNIDPLNPTQFQLETWVVNTGGKPTAADVNGSFPGLGFPGTETNFAGASILTDPRTFVFVADSDGDLSTHETFPVNAQISLRINDQVRSTGGFLLERGGVASTTVGPDSIPAEVATSGGTATIVPGQGDVDIDPETSITVDFTEPVQLPTIGNPDDGLPPNLSAAILVSFGPPGQMTQVPFHVELPSIFDLSRLELVPAYNFPGSGPSSSGLVCGNYSQVTVAINQLQFTDFQGNLNQESPSISFTTGQGPGMVNAPVTPDAIYLARGGSDPGVSVVDLNGFGQGTGNPTYDIAAPWQDGNSNFPNNPNVAVQGAILIPPLSPGSCTVDGGSGGAFNLAVDSALNDKLAAAPVLESVGDMALGYALDNTFNNGSPFGCQAGGGNICASTGLKVLTIAAGGASTQAPSTVSTFPLKTEIGGENLAAWAPHPNPPPLRFPPLCISPAIGGLEPTSIDTIAPPPIGPGLINLLSPGDPFGIPSANRPPDGLLAKEQNTFFLGPSAPQQQIANCSIYMLRQQIGQFLYVIDRVASEIVVFNSNRFTVLDRIRLPDPTSLAMSPNLDFLAVTNQNANTVSFVDIDPGSATFHEIVETVVVGQGPIGIAWDSGNEDILVCNQRESTVTVISAFTFQVRKVLRSQLNGPFDVAITPRQSNFGFLRNVYFAYVLNRDGSLVVFESGPDGVNGWGFDDVIGTLPFTFFNPKAIQPDPAKLQTAAIWIAHENPLDLNGNPTGETGGAITSIEIRGGRLGILTLGTTFLTPTIRNLQFGVVASIGQSQLTGIPVDIAFDNQRMQTSLTNFSTSFSASTPLSINGKSIVKASGAASQPTGNRAYLFAAVPISSEGPGVVDVIDLSAGFRRFDTDPFQAGVQSIPAPNVNGLMDYLRQ